MSDYKDLNLNRATLDENIQTFLLQNHLSLDGGIQTCGSNRKRVVFGAPGTEFATVDLYLNKTGTTTIHWDIGKNRPLGEKLAAHLKATLNPAEFDQVNYALEGITQEAFDAIFSLLSESKDIEISTLRNDDVCHQIKIRSYSYQDTLTLSHYHRTRRLQLQGRPLSCYRQVIFLLTDLLDLKGLEQVLYRKNDSSAEIVRQEVAKDYLKSCLPHCYEQLPQAITKLLISGCCVKLAAPLLPDYCLLLFPDLRALEGVLKSEMSLLGLSFSAGDNTFGQFFTVHQGICTLKPEFETLVNNPALIHAFNQAYGFFRKNRHTLFHMEEFPDGSRMIDTLEKAVALSRDTYEVIDAIYEAKLQK